jgi:crotonobetainyl-CoA:carnitine CoA-transferase CaiB-like acyl-CoA transferase
MAAEVDVVVESFRPGVMARLGIDYDNLAHANERIVLCSISGYGQEGPFRDVPGHDLDYLARSGVLAMFGPKGGVPVVPGVQIADLAGGALPAAVAVLAALMEREKTGRGRLVDISITRGAQSLLGIELARRAAGDVEPRGEGYLTGGVPCYRVYRTKDGRFMALAALEPKFFAAFCERAGCPHLAPLGLARGEQGATAMRELESIFAGRTQQEWAALLDGVEACCEPVRSPEEALADPGVGARSIDLDGLRLVGPELGAPLPEDARRTVPPLGAHGLEVASELHLDEGLVERAVADGALMPGLVGGEGEPRDRTT